jgi:hypothetical protein
MSERDVAAVRAKIGMVFQSFNPFPHLTPILEQNGNMGKPRSGSMKTVRCGLCGATIDRWAPISRLAGLRLPSMETAMPTKKIQDRLATPLPNRAWQIGKGVLLAGAIAVLALSTTPRIAYAGNNAGAAIGLGILGGVIAGAAIASSAPPVYGYPAAPVYGYPPQPYPGYYYNMAPAYYPAQPYYGWTPYYR